MQQTEAEPLSRAQATDLLHVLELQSRWENHCDDPAKSAKLNTDLMARQKTSEAYQAALREYAATYRTTRLPEPTHAVPRRLAVWCRILRGVFQCADGAYPVALMAHIARLADRTAVKAGREPVVVVVAGETLADAIRQMDSIIAWCEG
jgi:hypothetical protein